MLSKFSDSMDNRLGEKFRRMLTFITNYSIFFFVKEGLAALRLDNTFQFLCMDLSDSHRLA